MKPSTLTELRQAVEADKDGHWNAMGVLAAAERLAGGQVVTDAMVEAAAKSLWPATSPTWEEAFNSPPSSSNGYQVVHWLRKARTALEAAFAGAKP